MEAVNKTLSTAQRVAKMLLEIKAVTLSPEKPYTYTSGIIAPIYTDNRLLMGYPLKRKEVTVYMANLIKDLGLEPEIIAGTSTAGIPPATWLAELLNLPMIYVRGNKKDHGKGRQIEGPMEKGQAVLLIEDLISTGQSSLSAVDAIRDEGGKIDTCIAFFDYGFPDTAPKYAEKKIDFYTLTSLSELVDMAVKLKIINESQKMMVLNWQKDPWKWGEKFK